MTTENLLEEIGRNLEAGEDELVKTLTLEAIAHEKG